MKQNRLSTLDKYVLDSILEECRQCGSCCKRYRKILLQADEVDFIKKMGGHVGVDVHLNDLRTKSMDELIEEAKDENKVYMIHPDDKGCIFLEKRNGKYGCKIYHYRPLTCRTFKCTMADNSFQNIFEENAICLLGMNQFGMKLK